MGEAKCAHNIGEPRWGAQVARDNHEIAKLLRPDDWIVAHNCYFDLETCLARTAQTQDCQTESLHFILSLPRFCTMNCAYIRSVSIRRPNLAFLCKHFGVAFDETAAHDATYDSYKLALCVAEASRRGVMLDTPYTAGPGFTIGMPEHPASRIPLTSASFA